MTSNNEKFTEQVAELTSEVKSVLKEAQENGATVSEMKEKMGKVETDLSTALEQLKKIEDEPVRDYREVDGESVVHKIKALGVKSREDLRSIAQYEGSGKKELLGKRFDEDVKSALRMLDDCYIAHTLASLVARGNSKYVQECHQHGVRATFRKSFPTLGRQLDDFSTEFENVIEKAAGDYVETGQAGYGAEWVPDGWASSLLDDIRLALPTVSAFARFNMPTPTFYYPVLNGLGTAYMRTEVANAIKSNLGTTKRTWAAKTFASYQAFTMEMSQDSIVAVLPEIRAAITRNLGEALELAIVSGDTASTHMDNDTHTDTNTASRVERAWDGLRDYALNVLTGGTVNAGGNALTAADILSAMDLMGKYAAGRPGELVAFVNTASYLDLLADTSMVTVDKYGPQATILTGEVGRVYGVPVVISHGVEDRKDVTNASGVNAATSSTFSTALVLNRTAGGWRIGDRQQVMFEQDKNIVNGVTDVVATARWSFNCGISSSSAKHTVAIINIDD